MKSKNTKWLGLLRASKSFSNSSSLIKQHHIHTCITRLFENIQKISVVYLKRVQLLSTTPNQNLNIQGKISKKGFLFRGTMMSLLLLLEICRQSINSLPSQVVHLKLTTLRSSSYIFNAFCCLLSPSSIDLDRSLHKDKPHESGPFFE